MELILVNIDLCKLAEWKFFLALTKGGHFNFAKNKVKQITEKLKKLKICNF